jgi:hypothetical protein
MTLIEILKEAIIEPPIFFMLLNHKWPHNVF